MQDRLERMEVACSHGEEVVKKTESEREAVEGKIALLAKKKTQLEAEVIRGVSFYWYLCKHIQVCVCVCVRERMCISFSAYTHVTVVQSKCPCKRLTTPLLGLLALPMLCNIPTA